MADTTINTTTRLYVAYDLSDTPVTGLTDIQVDVYAPDNNQVVTDGTATEIGGGLYFYDVAANLIDQVGGYPFIFYTPGGDVDVPRKRGVFTVGESLDALAFLDVAVSTRALAGSTVSVSSPTAQNGDFRTVQGRDYSPVIDTAIIWTLTNPPGITPTTVTFTCSDLEFSKACSYSSPTITLTLTAAELAALSTGVYSFNVEAIISGLKHPGLLSGMWTIERDV